MTSRWNVDLQSCWLKINCKWIFLLIRLNSCQKISQEIDKSTDQIRSLCLPMMNDKHVQVSRFYLTFLIKLHYFDGNREYSRYSIISIRHDPYIFKDIHTFRSHNIYSKPVFILDKYSGENHRRASYNDTLKQFTGRSTNIYIIIDESICSYSEIKRKNKRKFS